MKNILDLVTEEMNATKDLIAKSYNAKGLKASGKFERSLEVKIQQTSDGIKAKILGSYHTQFMQNGRQPNKEQTAKQARGLGKILEQWVQDKGISVNPYAAAWKIVREGIKVPNAHNDGRFIDDVINESWLKQFSDKIRIAQIGKIKSDILRQWQL